MSLFVILLIGIAVCFVLIFLFQTKEIEIIEEIVPVVESDNPEVIKFATDFLNEVYHYESSGEIEIGMSFTFDVINRLLCDGKYDICDEILRSVDESKLTARLLLTFLTITNAAKHELNNRKNYYNRAWKRIETLEGKFKTKQILQNLG